MLNLLELSLLVMLLETLIVVALYCIFRYLGLTVMTVPDRVTNRRATDAKKTHYQSKD